MAKETKKKNEITPKIGEFGVIYRQFENKPKEAMVHLSTLKSGECPKAFYRDDIGFVDFVWGEPDTVVRGKKKSGFGLCHILTDHGDEIRQFGIEPIDFILMLLRFGKIEDGKKGNKIFIEGELYRLIITTEWYGKAKQLLLTAFDLRPIGRKNPKRAAEMKKASRR